MSLLFVPRFASALTIFVAISDAVPPSRSRKMTGEPSPADRLSGILAGAGSGTRPSENCAEDPMDSDLAAQAAADDARRAQFDKVLATPNTVWMNEDNPSVLREALVGVLSEIRGPALETVGVEAASSAPSAFASPDAMKGDAGVDTNTAGSSDAPLPGEFGQHDTVRAGEAAMEEEPKCSRIASGLDTSIRERAKYIPMRLSHAERKMLRLLEGALNVSQYTDVVDVLSYSRLRTKQRIHQQIIDLCSVLSGLMVASDYSAGQELIANRDFADNDSFFQSVFEIGRRHKIANPEKMRSSYGKLVFLLQDSQSDEVARLLDFSCVRPLRTVASFLETANATALVSDPLVATATCEIIAAGKPRSAVQRAIKEKERAVEVLARRYAAAGISEDDVRTCLYSIGDNNAFLRCNRDPCDDLLRLLDQYFGPNADKSGQGSSLGIRRGVQGARLTHDHARQYQYCLQSLTLWSAISQHMYQLWYLAETDLFDSGNPYSLRNTGQGLNRVQAAPRVARCMHKILLSVQNRVGAWIGSSVIHLGDSMVPNAFVFIDKYAVSLQLVCSDDIS